MIGSFVMIFASLIPSPLSKSHAVDLTQIDNSAKLTHKVGRTGRYDNPPPIQLLLEHSGMEDAASYQRRKNEWEEAQQSIEKRWSENSNAHLQLFVRQILYIAAITIAGILCGLALATALRGVFFLPLDWYSRRIKANLINLRKQSDWPGRRILESLRSITNAPIRREFLTLGLDTTIPLPEGYDSEKTASVTTVLQKVQDYLESIQENTLANKVSRAKKLFYRYSNFSQYRSVLSKVYYFAIPALFAVLFSLSIQAFLKSTQTASDFDHLHFMVISGALILSTPLIIYWVGQTIHLATWSIAKRSTTEIDDVLYLVLSWFVAGVAGLVIIYTSFHHIIGNWESFDNEGFDRAKASIRAIASPGHPDKSELWKTFLPSLDNSQVFFIRVFFVSWITGILILLLRLTCSRIFKRLAARTQQKHDDMAVEIIRLFGTFIIAAVGVGWIFVLFIGQYGEMFHLSGTAGEGNALMPYAILVAVLGAILGVGSKDLLENFFAGISLQIDKPFEPGERIVIDDGEVCEVKVVGMRSTHFYNITENSDMYIPNTELARKTVTNLSRPDRQYRRSLKFYIKDNDAETLILAESLMTLAAFTVEGVDISNILTNDMESADFHTDRKGIVAEYEKLQSRFDELTNALIRFQGKLESVNEIVERTCNTVSKILRTLNRSKSARWDPREGKPAFNDKILKKCENRDDENQFTKEIRADAARAHKACHAFYQLAMCFYTLGAAYSSVRPELEHLSLEILRAPTVRSSHKITDDGDTCWELELLVYAQLTEQSDEIINHLNIIISMFLNGFDLLPRDKYTVTETIDIK